MYFFMESNPTIAQRISTLFPKMSCFLFSPLFMLAPLLVHLKSFPIGQIAILFYWCHHLLCKSRKLLPLRLH